MRTHKRPEYPFVASETHTRFLFVVWETQFIKNGSILYAFSHTSCVLLKCFTEVMSLSMKAADCAHVLATVPVGRCSLEQSWVLSSAA